MQEFLSSNPDEFDKQIKNHLDGIGQSRSILSGSWRKWINEAAKLYDIKMECVAAWENDTGIFYTMQNDQRESGVHYIEKEKVSELEAVRTIVGIVYSEIHYKVLLLPEYLTPFEFEANSALYRDLICKGYSKQDASRLYYDLGGE